MDVAPILRLENVRVSYGAVFIRGAVPAPRPAESAVSAGPHPQAGRFAAASPLARADHVARTRGCDG